MINKAHPLYETVKLFGTYSFEDSQLIADGNYVQLLERLRTAALSEHYFHGWLHGGTAVFILYWGRELSRATSAYNLAWLLVTATVLGANLWTWRKRKRALRSALSRLECDLAEGRLAGAGT